ncbi:hypothetical protein Pan2_94 [Pseudanabaena phage Pan2]|nr:hypothetical protein Pan2_94 [Pseudanabaena phage Pan2]
MTSKKGPKWIIEVVQLEEERIPTRWQRFWGDLGNPYAWHVTFYREGEFWTQDWTSGYTKAEARFKAEEHIAQIEARENMRSASREVFYVEGS